MVDGEKVLTMALTAGGRQTPTVAVTAGTATVTTPTGATRRVALKTFDELSLVRRVAAPGVATLVVRRRGVDYRAMAVDAREFTVTVPPGSLVGSKWAPDDAWMVMNVLSAEV